jgi:phage-related protein
VWRITNTYTLTTSSGYQATVGWDPEAGPNFLGYLSNITSSTDFRLSSMERAQQDGLITGNTYLAGRSVAIDLKIIDSDPVVRGARLREIGVLAAKARVEDVAIDWVEDDGSARRVIGRLAANPALQHEDQSPVKSVQLSFLCPDPHIQSGGVFQQEHAAGVSFDVDHIGNSTATPIIKIYGGGTSFLLQWETFNTEINTTLAAGEYITLDSFNRTITKSNGLPLFSALSTSSDFPILPANSATTMQLTVTGSSGTPKVRVEHRAKWLF